MLKMVFFFFGVVWKGNPNLLERTSFVQMGRLEKIFFFGGKEEKSVQPLGIWNRGFLLNLKGYFFFKKPPHLKEKALIFYSAIIWRF